MIPEIDKTIEKFILGELKMEDLEDFQLKMKDSRELANEVKINQEIANSILEQDIMDLRTNLRNICSSIKENSAEQTFFDFAQNLSVNSNHFDFSSDISLPENSLQQIHLETHLKCMTERKHRINLKPDHKQEIILANQINDFLFEEEIKNAILEKDVFELRSTLKEIVSQGFINFSDFEIDQYRSNELPSELKQEISELVVSDKVMENQLKLHEEIDMAISENDILSLRNSLSEIIKEEQQISFEEINRIDDYLLEYLNAKDRSEFELSMDENVRLKEETILHSQINDAIIETDILKLRTNISDIIDKNKKSTKIRKFIPDSFQDRPLRYIGVAASAAAVISAGLFTLSQQKITSENLFQQAYHPYDAIGILRSAPLSNPSFKGIDLYNDRKFDEAIMQFDLILKENNEHPMCNFYTGLCYLEKNNFNKAIMSFQKVIDEKDNLFTEQAEWYMSLCLLKTNEEKSAFAILNRIVETKGYYQKDAKELLKKMR